MAEMTPVKTMARVLTEILADPKSTTAEKLKAAATLAKVTRRRRKPHNEKKKKEYVSTPENSLASIANKVV